MWKIFVPAVVVVLGLAGVAAALLPSGGPYLEVTVEADSSMSPTLRGGDLLTVRTDTAHDLRRGDIVAIDGASWPEPTDRVVLKRVIGVGGDRVRGDLDGRIEVNGHAVDEDYRHNDDAIDSRSPEFDVTVPPGTVFVAGDTRNNSFDSRLLADTPDQASFRPDAVLGTVVAIDGGTVEATTAFTDAGLTGAAYQEPRASGTRLLALIGSGVLTVLGAVALAVALVRRRAQTGS